MTEDFPLPPEDRDEILATVGDYRSQIYYMVRGTLDDLENAARWDSLYYPPSELDEFLALQRGLLALIGEIPYRVWGLQVQIIEDALAKLVAQLPDAEADPESRQTIAALIGPEAEASSPEARMSAKGAVEGLDEGTVGSAMKKIMRWLIDRDATQDGEQISMDDFDEAVQSFPENILDAGMKEILSNVPFYFDNIHHMTAGDVEKLEGQVANFESPDHAGGLTAEERVFTCEIAADLKGKYTSAIMGAAANLVAEGRWHGSDLEPILFPEKAEEFERNEQLVRTLQEVLESIQNVPKEVPLVEIVATWHKGKRVDRYALTHLYSFMSSVGKLMKESSRRALYSGDYHQIQQRESRLAARINELNMLHNRTWEVSSEDDPSVQDCYPRMVDKAIQLAAVLEVELLKKLVGAEMVSLLLQIVSIEGEKRRTGEIQLDADGDPDFAVPESMPLREKVPDRMRPVIGLLHDEDLQTFLELLLGSVTKRASFTVQRRREEAARRAAEREAEEKAQREAEEKAEREAEEKAEREAEEKARQEAEAAKKDEDVLEVQDMGMIDLEILPEPEVGDGMEPAGADLESSGPNLMDQVMDLDAAMGGDPFAGGGEGEAPADALSFDDAAPSAPAASTEDHSEKIADLETLVDLLDHFLSAKNPNRKSFDLVHRLLSSKGMVPPTMLGSIAPLIEDVNENLVPHLAKVSAQGAMPITYQGELTQYCRTLSRRDIAPRDMKSEVLPAMEGLLSLLGDVQAEAVQLIDSFRSAGSGVLSAVDDYLGG